MSDATTVESAGGGTGWKRFSLALIPALVGAGILVGLTAQGSIAASFAVSGQSFKVAADELDGTGFAQYGDTATGANDKKHPVGLTVVDEAELTNLCQSVLMDTGVGEVTLLVEAGQGDTPVTAENMVVDAEQLRGNATFTDIQIGRDASTLENETGEQGKVGGFGQQAKSVNVEGFKQTAWGVNASTFKLSGLKMNVKPGNHECY